MDPASLSGDPALYARVKSGGLLAAAGVARASSCSSASRAIPSDSAASRSRSSGFCRRSWRARLPGSSRRFAQGLAVMRQPGRLLVSLLLSFPLWLSIAAGIWVTSRAFHMTFGYLGSFLVMTLLVVGVAMPTPGQVGGSTRCYRIAVVTFFGVPDTTAVGAAIVLHAVSFVPVTLLGLVFMAREGFSLARIREMAERPRERRGRRLAKASGPLAPSGEIA